MRYRLRLLVGRQSIRTPVVLRKSIPLTRAKFLSFMLNTPHRPLFARRNGILCHEKGSGRIDLMKAPVLQPFLGIKNVKVTDTIVSITLTVVVPVAGLEPARCCQRWILSPIRQHFVRSNPRRCSAETHWYIRLLGFWTILPSKSNVVKKVL